MPSKKTVKNPTGSDRATRGARVSLAAFAREKFPPHIMMACYLKILEGKNPKVVKVDECDEEGCECSLNVTDDFNGGNPSIDQKMLAIARIVDRSHGQAAQHSVINQEIKAEVTAIAGGVNPNYLRSLSPAAIKALGEAIRGRATPALPEGEPDVIEDAVYSDGNEVNEDEP